MMNNDHYRVFKGLETDAEFVARIRKVHAWFGDYYSGDALDEYAWRAVTMQRKIVERSTEPSPEQRAKTRSR